MRPDDACINIIFENSGEENQVPLSDLDNALTGFLDHFGEKSFVGEPFYTTIGDGNGRSRRARLLEACGYAGKPEGFFTELLAKLGKADGTTAIAVNGMAMPHQLLMAILEIVLPGDKFVSVKTVDQLQKLANLRVPEADRADMQQVIDTYPVRLSMHTIRQMRVSGNVAYQYLPFVQELDTSSEVVVYAKLPRGFSIPTPVGNYNPDWAITFKEGTVKHVYFVAETKGSMSSMELREIEKTKIECARKFFDEINRKINPENVTYDVVDSFGKLMEIVGAAN